MNFLDDLLSAICDLLYIGDFFSNHPIIRLLLIAGFIAAVALAIYLICA